MAVVSQTTEPRKGGGGVAMAALAATGPPPPSLGLESFHHRLYEFAKAALIKIFVFPYATVCDLYCGDSTDTDKWEETQILHYIGVDASLSGISKGLEPWESQRKHYTTEFCSLDPSDENLVSYLHDKGIPADIVFCFHHLQSCFESEDTARNVLQNVSSLLKPGGYFLGITPDSSTIWTKYQKNVEASHNKGISLKPNSVVNSIRSENYVITFEAEEEKFPLFGKRYQLKFAYDAAFETHCLVHFPSLIRLAREAGLEYVEIQNLTEFYDDNRAQFAGLLSHYGPNFVDPRGRLLPRPYDVLGLYATFVFQKPDPDAAAPIVTPTMNDGNYHYEEQHRSGGNWRHQNTLDEENNLKRDSSVGPGNSFLMDHDKGILGPGPAELRFPEPM